MNAICLTFQFFFFYYSSRSFTFNLFVFFLWVLSKIEFCQYLSFLAPAYHSPTSFLRDTSVSFANKFPSWHQRIICQHLSVVTPAYHLPTYFLRDTSVSFANIFPSWHQCIICKDFHQFIIWENFCAPSKCLFVNTKIVLYCS